MNLQDSSDQERQPRYYRIYRAILDRIHRGELKPGDGLPSEMNLAQAYGVSPGTTRKAIDLLEERGWIDRQHGRGTFVRRVDFSHSLARFFRLTDRQGTPLTPTSELLGVRRVSALAEPLRQLELADDAELIEIERLRRVEDTPLLYETLYLPAARFAALLDLPDDEWGDLLYPLYERVCGEMVFRATDTLSAVTASDTVAAHLAVQRCAPVIEITRLARGYDERPLEWRISRGRLDWFHYSFDIR